MRLFILLLFISSKIIAQDNFEKQNVLLENTVTENKLIGIAAAYSINGKLMWEAAEGYSNLESKTPFTETTKTRIASISKTMTAVALFQLMEQNKIKLSDPIEKYIFDLPEATTSITIQQLLQHSSGISGYKNSKEQENTKEYNSLEEATNIFIDRDLLFEPGTQFQYTTYGYVVLGLIIEKASGLSYEEYLKRNIWDKAKMNNTGVEVFGKTYDEKSNLYHINSKGKINTPKPTNLSDRIPGGGIYSTVEDLIKFGDAILNNSLISEASKNEMFTNSGLKKEGNPYAMGWYLYGQNPKHGEVIGHNGAQTGASTFLMLLPEKNASVVVLSNTSGAMQTVSNVTISLFNFID